MAAGCTEKLMRALECPICFGTYKEPQALQCCHLYCHECIMNLCPVTKDKQTGFCCPLCRQFTAEKDIRPMYLINELLEIFYSCNKEKLCVKCKAKISTLRCVDCKENYCEECRKHHDEIPILSLHNWDIISEHSKHVINKHIHCSKHSVELVKFQCTKCNRLICILCNGSEHKNHPALTIEDSLAILLPVVNKNLDTIQSLIRKHERKLEEAKEHMIFLNEDYDKTEKNIEMKCKEVMRKALDDCKKLKADLHALKQQQESKVEEYMNTLKAKIKDQRQLFTLGDAMVSSAAGPSLLGALISGFSEKLALHTDQSENLEFEFTKLASFIPALKTQKNSVGQVSVCSESRVKHSMKIPRCLSGETVLSVKLNREFETDYPCLRCAVIRDELWCVGTDSSSIYIYNVANISKFGKKIVNFADIERCCAVTEVHSGVIIAALNGLFLTQKDCTKTRKLFDGQFCDVSVIGSTIYALNDDNVRIQIYDQNKQNKEEYIKIEEISLDGICPHSWNTIQVTENFIFLASYIQHTIFQFNHKGTFVQYHGSYGHSKDELYGPLLCGADPDGVILVADLNNNRLKTLTSGGQWECLKVDGLTYRPVCAVITAGKLITRLHKYIMQVFSLT